MYSYNLKIRLSDNAIIDEKIYSLIENAVEHSNNKVNALSYGRKIRIESISKDKKSLLVSLETSKPVIPSRSVSALSRSMIELDENNILNEHIYRGCVLNTTVINEENKNIDNLTDVELLKTLTEIVFEQQFNSENKKMAIQCKTELKNIAIGYLNKKIN